MQRKHLSHIMPPQNWNNHVYVSEFSLFYIYKGVTFLFFFYEVTV